MKKYWKIVTKHPNGVKIEKRLYSEEIRIGSHPHCHIKLRQPHPEYIALLEQCPDSGKLTPRIQCPNFSEIDPNETSQDSVREQFFKYQETLFEISDISHTQKRPNIEEWIKCIPPNPDTSKAIWHLHKGFVMESRLVDKEAAHFQLRSGYDLKWNPQDPFKLLLMEHDGDLHTLELKPIDGCSSHRAKWEEETFFLSSVPESGLLSQLEGEGYREDPDKGIRKAALAIFASAFFFISYINFVGFGPTELFDEEISADLARIEIQRERIQQARQKADNAGGNQRRGGGGVDYVAESDPRGGSGMGQIEEVVVNSRAVFGALGALSALSALDKLSANIPVAHAGPRIAQGSAGGALGALASLSASVSGKGGQGIGGVGTRGFGGGGGSGGSGQAGFGTATGSGLGPGDDLRRVSFDNESAQIRGGLERSEVNAVVRENIAQIRLCYNRGLRSNPALSGKVLSNFTIAASGQVAASRVAESTLATPDVERCISDRIATWQFPQPRGGGQVVVSYPFLLNSD